VLVTVTLHMQRIFRNLRCDRHFFLIPRSFASEPGVGELYHVRVLRPGQFRDILSLPVRHMVRTVNLHCFNYWPYLVDSEIVFHKGFSLDWKWAAFKEGTAKAMSTVRAHLVDERYDDLKDLVCSTLLRTWRKQQPAIQQEKWSEPPVLRVAHSMGIFSATALGEGDEVLLCVTVLVHLEEEYSYLDRRTASVKRLQKWAFEQRLDRAGNSDGWRVRDIDGNWYWQNRTPWNR